MVYLKKDLGDKKYEILDSAVVVNGSFKMQKPLGDVDERILEINGGTNIIILDSVPIHVKCETVKKMIERQKAKYGWEFLFLGANIDAVETASRFGIGADRAVNYHSDHQGTQLNYEVLSEAVSTVRCSAALGTEWKKRIDEDYEARKNTADKR